MSFQWNGRGFVKTTSNAAGRAASVLGHSLTQPATPPGGDEDIRQFRRWQSSKSSLLGDIGTHKYWTDSDDAARSLGGIGADFDRSQYNFRNIGARSTGKKRQPGRTTGDAQEDPKNKDMRPPEDPEAERERLGLNPGNQMKALPPGGRHHDLTDVRNVQYATGEVGPQRALGRGPGNLNFQTQVGGGDDNGGSVFGEIGRGQFPQLGRNVIEASARELGPAPTVNHTKDTARMGRWPASKTPSRLGRGLGEIMAEDDATPGSPHTAAYMAGDPTPLRESGGSPAGSFDFSSTAEPLYQPPKKMGRGV